MADFDDDTGFALYGDATYWWRRKRSRERVQSMVGVAVSNELERTRIMQKATDDRHHSSWGRVNAKFDPPQDDASLSERLHLPYTRRDEEPVYQSMAVDEDEVGDDAPPAEDGARSGGAS